jgi:hypothetical protein
MTFKPGAVVELFYDDTWNDITALGHVQTRDPITITRGRANESSRVQAAKCPMTLDNRDGRYSPRNPASPLYGKIGRNTPIRVKVGSDVRFTGEVPAWPQAWDKPGKNVWTSIEPAGVMRRLGQGASPLRSAPRRAIEASGPVAYWPLDDGKQATTAAAAAGEYPLRPSIGATEFGHTRPAEWLETLPRFPDSSLKGRVHMPGFTDEWGIGSIVDPEDSSNFPFISVQHRDEPNEGRISQSLFVLSSTLLRSAWTFFPDDGGSSSGDDFDWVIPADFFDGRPHWWELRLNQDGSNIDHAVYVDGVALTLAAGTAQISSRTLEAPYLASIGGDGEDVLGHFAVWDDLAAMDDVAAAALGHPGEAAGRRIERLCDEQGVAFSSAGDLDDTAAMGPQPIDTFLELLGEAADADLGILHEPRDSLGLAYRTRVDLYNQAATLELPYVGVFGSLPEPVDDDQAVRNDITVKRPEGSSARAQLLTGALSVQPPPDGVGRYDTSADVNVAGDGFLPEQASWRLHLGTVDEARYPRIHLNLAGTAFKASGSMSTAAKALDIGDRLTVDNPPAWLPPGPISQLAQGFVETIGNNTWDIEVNCTPESPWQVAEYEATAGGDYRYDTAGSTLAAEFDAGTDTSMSVDVDVLPLWTTDDAETPFDIECGGVRLTVTDITGSSSPQTFTITQAPVNGIEKTIPAGTAVSLWTKARYAL